MKRIALIAFLFGASTLAAATTLPTVVDESVSLATGQPQIYPAPFADRASYKLMILLEPALDFHGDEGRKIKWGGYISFTVTVTAGGKVVLKESQKVKIDHSMGLWNRRIRVPDDIPAGADAIIAVSFEDIDPALKSVYRRARLVVNRFPYSSLLD